MYAVIRLNHYNKLISHPYRWQSQGEPCFRERQWLDILKTYLVDNQSLSFGLCVAFLFVSYIFYSKLCRRMSNLGFHSYFNWRDSGGGAVWPRTALYVCLSNNGVQVFNILVAVLPYEFIPGCYTTSNSDSRSSYQWPVWYVLL